MIKPGVVYEIALVDGKFEANDAIEIIESLVNGRKKIHNIQLLRMWESNHNFNASHLEKKLNEMSEEKNKIKTKIAKAKKDGCRIEVYSTICVRISPVTSESSMSSIAQLNFSDN